MDQRDDMSYLKRYVQSHPDNRMAWYLLGKQYILEDKEAKANYCFLQAGSIYEAYERKRHPLASEPQHIIKSWNRKRKFKMLAARTVTATIILLLAIIANPFVQLYEEENMKESLTTATYDKTQGEKLDVVFVNPVSEKAVGQSLGALLEGSGSAETGLAVMLEQDEKWRKWTGDTRILLSTKKQGSGQGYAIQMLDAKTCNCQPSDSSEAFAVYQDWSGVQEERWTLISAISQYQDLFNKWPETIDDMVRPYPNNVLSGQTGNMRAMFPAILKQLKARAQKGTTGLGGIDTGDSNNGKPDVNHMKGSAAGSQSQALTLPETPLSIIVDRKTHRLAVVSGDVIVRSYSVGLGGDKTPGGSFYISEKVKNPNGHDDGEFGSRGMTLSGTRYAIHGTNEPSSVGKDESHGCVRMNKEDVEELFDLVPLGTKVEIKSGVLPVTLSPEEKRFKLQPMQDETNPAVVYRWLT
ncbi:hypothetical protein Back11_06790 [Paenibacillus baekrokdamisoli]|uniref:L,D-TPase catalytic domain-containing protein n=1 Tax=Paenibacillus baekrokdamisoli TaxID=1712516 RepID=A0A3G9J7U8_9BACL|nr:L,D-transpeptidase [Paenibacillus baekrokdamisoli]MBB3067481.1 lipoprotein-anchoring transpeptidase ErfK/SrfK [Paenibacillus baekrokdamisoli]BBH19334.1 hypothetical protein Back11_06790 [Paenibacillus baekrokdamisoli]